MRCLGVAAEEQDERPLPVDSKRTTTRNGGGLFRRGRQVKCAAGVGGDGDRLGGLVLALGVGHSVPVWTGEFAAGGR